MMDLPVSFSPTIAQCSRLSGQAKPDNFLVPRRRKMFCAPLENPFVHHVLGLAYAVHMQANENKELGGGSLYTLLGVKWWWNR